MKKIAAVFISLLMLAAYAYADTIYIWTDDEGVRRFSDQPPPKGVEEYETAVGSISRPDKTEGQREGLKKMLEEQEAQKVEDRAREEEAKSIREAEEQQKAQAEANAQIDAERRRLQEQISQIQKRALSPTFTEGMRQNQINEIQKKIDALK